MQTAILEQLQTLEQQKEIRILYACESGSRAWGFPSPDSDYDVRFIYNHPLDWYLALRDKEDTIELPVSQVLDTGGWDIRKMLGLLWKSNAPLLEWVQSPIIYKQDTRFIEDLRAAGRVCFSPVAVMHHYLSMSKKYYDMCQAGNQVKLKHYFYALRTTVACKWIREKRTMPPIQFTNMLDLLDSIRALTESLITVKAGQQEGYLHVREPEIDSFLLKTIQENEHAAAGLPPAKADIKDLEDLFRKWIQ